MSASGRTPATCPVCGAGIHPKDRFCGACGADVVASGSGSDSLFDELMPQDDRRTAATPAQGYRTPAEGYDEHPDDRTAAAAGAAGAAGGYGADEFGRAGGYDHPAPSGPAGAYPDVPPAPREEGPSRGSVLLPLAVLVVVVLAAVIAWQLAPRGGGNDRAATGTTSSQDASGSPSSQSSGDESPSGEATQSAGPEQVEMASSAKRCDDVGDAVAYRGNDVTSCDFAVSVAQALQDADPELPATVTARSPVTKKKYDMQCENTAPVTCRGGNDALVYVDRG